MKQDTTKSKLFNRYSERDKRKFFFVFTFMVFPVLQIAVFYFFVNFYSFTLAFTNYDGSFGLGSFKQVFEAFSTGVDNIGFDPMDMVYKSVLTWLIGQTGSIFTILSCYVLTKHMIGSRVFRLIYYIPGIVGGVMITAIWKEMFAHNGIIMTILKAMDVKLPARAIRSGLLGADETAFMTITLYRWITSLAGGGMIMAAAYMRIPNEIFESCQLEGCGFFRETFQIALPCIWPTFSTLLLFSFCGILTADYGAYVWSNGTGNHGLVSVGYYLYRYQVTVSEVPVGNDYLYGYISAFGMLITFITIPIVLGCRWLLTKIQEDVDY